MPINDTKLDSEKVKKYREDTTLNQHQADIETSFETGTIKITEELYKQAEHALSSRIKETKDYTEKRIARINKNYELYYGQVLPIIRDSVDDWVDKLYNIFDDFGDAMKIKSDGVDLDSFITKKLDVAEAEDKAPEGRLRSLLKFVLKDKFVEKDIYYFMKKEVTKSFLQSRIKKAEIKTKMEDFLFKGVISGMFCMKEGWGETADFKINVHKETEGSKKGKEYTSLGKFGYDIESEHIYKVTVPDTRQLIFRKDSLDWVMEHIKTNFWKLIEDSVDEKGKPKKNAVYDWEMLARVKDMLKKNPNAMPLDADKRIALNFQDECDMTGIYELEGNVEVVESHHIPLVLKGKPTKCVIAALNIEEKLIPVRIQPTSFIRNNPYKTKEFLYKEGDISGQGLPEKLELLSKEVNDMNVDIQELVKMSVKGITAGDHNYISNPGKLNNLSSGDHIQLKNTKGRPIREVLEFFMPNLSGIGTAFDVLKFNLDFIAKLSRKGAGEKIAPNPSATEANVIMDTQEQPINRVGMRLNNFFGGILENMYFYTLLNRDSRFALKLQGSRIKKQADPTMPGVQGIDTLEKDIELTRDELLIEGVQFTVEAVQLEDNKQPVQKQQYMQAMTLLYNTIKTTEQSVDPATGQPKEVPKVFKDDNGNDVELNTFGILSDYLEKMNISNPWKPVEQDPVMPGNPNPDALTNGQPGTQPPQVNQPPLTATPANGDILAGAQQV